jgi:hypothetical protein
MTIVNDRPESYAELEDAIAGGYRVELSALNQHGQAAGWSEVTAINYEFAPNRYRIIRSDTPRTDAMVWRRKPTEFDGEIVAAAFARELERENAKLREALGAAKDDLARLFTVLPISGPLPSPSVMQHVAYALNQ